MLWNKGWWRNFPWIFFAKYIDCSRLVNEIYDFNGNPASLCHFPILSWCFSHVENPVSSLYYDELSTGFPAHGLWYFRICPILLVCVIPKLIIIQPWFISYTHLQPDMLMMLHDCSWFLITKVPKKCLSSSTNLGCEHCSFHDLTNTPNKPGRIYPW
jgi:hypothetical protein